MSNMVIGTNARTFGVISAFFEGGILTLNTNDTCRISTFSIGDKTFDFIKQTVDSGTVFIFKNINIDCISKLEAAISGVFHGSNFVINIKGTKVSGQFIFS